MNRKIPARIRFKKWHFSPRLKKQHTARRLFNLFLSRLGLILRLNRAIGYPTYLVIEPTNICNLKCPLCPTGQGRPGREKGHMSLSNFKKIIDSIGRYAYSLRLENWGEPLLNKEVCKMVSYAKEKNIATSFNTNLCSLDKKSAEDIILSGLDHIKISLDGCSPASYSKYRIGGDFAKVIDNIRLLAGTRLELKRKNPFIEIQFIVMKHNEAEIGDILKLSRSLGADGALIENLRPDMRQELFNSDIESIDKFKEWLPENSEYSLFDYNKKKRKNKKRVCGYLWTTAVINWDGSLAPCCSIFDTEYDFGNFFSDGFKEVWNGPKYRAMRSLFSNHKNKKGIAPCFYCFKNGVIA